MGMKVERQVIEHYGPTWGSFFPIQVGLTECLLSDEWDS
jgi:hypothetical protein